MGSGSRPGWRDGPYRSHHCRGAGRRHKSRRHRRRGHQPHLARQPAAGPHLRGHSGSTDAPSGLQGSQGRPRPRQRQRARARSEAASRQHHATGRFARVPCLHSCRHQRCCNSEQPAGFPLRGRLYRLAPMAQLRRRPRTIRRCLRAAAHRATPGPQSCRSSRRTGRRRPARPSRNKSLHPKPAHPLSRGAKTACKAQRERPADNRHLAGGRSQSST